MLSPISSRITGAMQMVNMHVADKLTVLVVPMYCSCTGPDVVMIRRVLKCTPLILPRQFIVFAFLSRKWILVHKGVSRRSGPH